MSNQAPIQTSISTFIDNNEGTLDPTGANNKNYSVADLRFSEGYSDADGNAGGIAITSVDSTKGILWYSTDTGNTWSKVLGVDAAHALLLTATSNNLLYYQAVQTLTNVNYNGTNNAVFTYRAWDQTTGVNGGLANTSINGNTSAFSQVERVVDGVILDINDAPTLTLSTTQSRINHSSPVKVFDNINAGAGEDDTGVNALIKQIVLNVTGVKNSNNEILTINGVDIPLKATATVFTLPDGGICKVVGTASILTLTLINDTGWVSTGVNNQVNQLLDSVTYKNVYVTSTVADIEGERVITVRSMTDLGTQSTGNNAYAPKNTASFANLISKVMIDKTAPNAPITVTVPENDGVGITPIEAQNGTEVVVSLVGTNALEGDVIRVVVKNLAPIQYTLLGTDILNNSASVTIPQATLQAAGQGTAPVVVTITDAANNTSVPSTVNINLVVQNTAPTGAPAITGTPTQGQVLTASLGTLADIDGLGTLSYKWYANGTEIIGATASTLTLTQAQVNKTITVSASYTDGLGKLETVSSVATAAVANVNDLPTGVPTITGTAMQGQVLTVSSIGINDLDGLGTISYKWYANGTEITGATATTYTLTQAEVGKAITVKASYIDGGNTLETVSSAATANVTNVNDAPSATSSTITLLEDGSKTFAASDFGFSDVDGNTLSAVIISTLPAAGTLKLSGVAVTAGQSIPVASLGNLIYTPAANANGTAYASIGFKVQDNGGVANGGIDTSAAATLTINVTPVNDAPSATSSTITVVEDGSKTFTAADFGFSDVDGNTLSAVIISTLPAAGTLKLSGVAVTAGQSIPVASLGNLIYTPAANANGAAYASIGFKVQDNGGVANGGVDTSAAATLTINVTPVNDAPSATSSTITVVEDGSKTFAASDFGFSDVDGNTLSAVIISTLPAAGTLKLSGVAVTAGQSIPVASLGNLIYTPAANANGTGYASIGFKVQDNGGVANGGVDTSTAATLTINVTPVNDAPSATSSTITVVEDGSKTFAASDFGFSDVDGNTLSAVIISTLPSAGSLTLSGVAVAAGQSIPVASLGNLVYTPAANANGTGYASIGFKVQDNGGVANGGVDTSTAATLTINVTPVNDAPSATSSTITVVEDGSKTFATSDFGFSDVDGNTLSAVIISTLPAAGMLKLSGIAVTAGQSIPVASLGNLVYTPAANANGTGYASIGFKVQDNGGVANGGVDTSAAATLTVNVTPVNDAPSATSSTIIVVEDGSKTFAASDFGFSDVDGNTLSAVIISTLPAAGTLKLSGVAVTAGQSIPVASLGNLIYTPAANANGTGYASIGFKVQDNGGVANGGVDTSAAATLTVNVTPVNDAPSATSSTITVVEDGSKTFAASDFGFSDVDGNTLSAVIISTLPAAGTLKLSGVAVTAGQSIPVASLGNLVYTPAANANGTGYASIGFKVQDNGGVANGGVDTSTAATLTINVTPVNDAPSATSNAITVVEDGSKTFAASDFGFSDVDGNTLSAVIISTLPAAGSLTLSGVAVTVGQSIPVASLGNLVYTPAANANGTAYASIGFKVQDNGGVANGGVDTSAAATLTINVTPVNDAPSAISSTITLLEDGSKTFAASDFGFSDVDGNTLSAVIISTLPAAGTLKLSGVAVTAGQSIPVASLGNLVYTPAANANGTGYASIGFKVQDNGGVANGGIDTSAAATLTINVTPVNDAPTLVTQIPDQMTMMGTAFSYTMPTNTFADVDSTLTYSATRGDGTALPAWMTFNPTTATFTGTPTSTIDFNVKVIASDGALTVSDTFHIGLLPVANSAAITSATGIQNNFLNVGDIVTVTVTFSELVNVTGTPQLTLNIGGSLVKANYVSGTGSTALAFSYTILANQTDANGISIGANSLGLNGGTITDASGNNATQNFAALADNISYMVDTTAPSVGTLSITDTGSNATDGITNNGVVTVGSLETGATWEYSTDSGSTWTTGTGTSFTLSEGTYAANAVQMRETDKAGNLQTGTLISKISSAITLDTIAPSIGTLALASDTGTSSTDGITKNGTINVGSLETGATWEYSTDSGNTWTTGTGTSFTLSAGNYAVGVVQMRETDQLGNVQTGSLIAKNAGAIAVDTTAPVIGNLSYTDTGSSATDGITKNATIAVASLESGATWEYSKDSGTTWATGTGTSFTLGAGTYAANAIQMRETDKAGNVQTGTLISKISSAITLDSTAPTMAVTMSNTNLSFGQTSLVTFTASETVTNFTNSDVTVLNGTLSTLTTTDNKIWTATYTPTINVLSTSNQISVAANSYTDVAGNNGAAATGTTYAVSTSYADLAKNLGVHFSASDSSSVSFSVIGMSSLTSAEFAYPNWSTIFANLRVNFYSDNNLIGTTPDWTPTGMTMTWANVKVGSQIRAEMHTVDGTGSWNITYGLKFNYLNSTRYCYTTPLALDLNGDGVQTIAADSGVEFDLLNTGTKQSLGWLSKQDGWLAMDLNGDGQINSGAELFGEGTTLEDGSLAKDGWSALAVLDTNADNKIDMQDTHFNDLRVWVDANSDGLTDAGELHTLSQVNVQSIDLNHDGEVSMQNGNLLQGFSTFTTTDGQAHEMVDALVSVDAPELVLTGTVVDTLI